MAFRGKVENDELDANAGTGSLLDQLRAQKDETEFDNAIPWVPVMADEGLEGTVVGIGSFHDDKYGNDRILRTWVVEDANGDQWSLIPFHRQLAKQMTMHRAEVGDTVGILYLGEFPSPTDPEASFKKYRVARVAAARQRRMTAASAPRVMTPDKFSEKVDEKV